MNRYYARDRRIFLPEYREWYTAAMTHPSYYDDPLAHTFTTNVTAVEGNGSELVLAETLFYPEGGGQPADIGSIAGHAVVDVQKDTNGVIRHHLEAPAPAALEAGTTVSGEIDWSRRWDYMQQHTGQHVLSAALAQVAHASTVSVHQGSEITTIEVDREAVSEAELYQVEERANEIIRGDLTVRGFWIDDSELSEYALRRPTSRTGAIRLVEIEGVDLVACGGVHLPRTGLLNVIHLTSVERIRGRLRLGFKIGDRAIQDYREKDRLLTAAAEHFSAHPADVPARIATMAAEVQELHRTHRLQAQRIAEHLFAIAQSSPGLIRTVELKDEDPEVFSALAEIAGAHIQESTESLSAVDASREAPPLTVCILNATDGGLHWALAVGVIPFPQKQLRSEVLEPVGAKGGGKPPLWRGIIKEPTPETGAELLSRLQAVLGSLDR